MTNAVVIAQPVVDFPTFLGLTHSLLGISLAAQADSSVRKLSHSERFLSCLSAIDGDSDTLLGHLSYSLLVATQATGWASGMHFVTCGQCSVVTGNLSQWRAVINSDIDISPDLLAAFERIGLASIFERDK